VCAKCYGPDPDDGTEVFVGEPVGLRAAWSIAALMARLPGAWRSYGPIGERHFLRTVSSSRRESASSRRCVGWTSASGTTVGATPSAGTHAGRRRPSQTRWASEAPVAGAVADGDAHRREPRAAREETVEHEERVAQVAAPIGGVGVAPRGDRRASDRADHPAREGVARVEAHIDVRFEARHRGADEDVAPALGAEHLRGLGVACEGLDARRAEAEHHRGGG